MLASTHALMGAMFASQIHNPTIALTASFLSHPLLDLFPHWDFNSRWSKITKFQKFVISATDSSLGIIAGLLLFADQANWWLILASMLIAQWADFLEAPYHFGFDKYQFFKTIKHWQHLWHTKASWPWGFIPQAIIMGTAVWISFFFSN